MPNRNLTIPEARGLRQAAPNIFRNIAGTETVDLNNSNQGLILQQLAATHVQVLDDVTCNNCLEWAVGMDCALCQDLHDLVNCCTRHGWQELHPNDANALVDIWGQGTNVYHGTKRIRGSNPALWSSVMGMGNICVSHLRDGLVGGHYGVVITSFRATFTSNT